MSEERQTSFENRVLNGFTVKNLIASILGTVTVIAALQGGVAKLTHMIEESAALSDAHYRELKAESDARFKELKIENAYQDKQNELRFKAIEEHQIIIDKQIDQINKK